MQNAIIHIWMETMQEILIAGCRDLGLELTRTQIEQFQIFYQELIYYNSKVNLTAITEYQEVQIKHFLDSISVAQAAQSIFMSSINVLDVGSGAGFPGIPLKIAFPQITMTLLEATGKKVKFLQHVISLLELENTKAIAGRAEEIAHQPLYREMFDVVTARALSELPTLIELTLPFCRIGGKVIAQKKGDMLDELKQMEKAMHLLGGHLAETKMVELPGLQDGRSLVVIEKIRSTPPKYPRRPGIPNKRPIR
jgi:16S rRNA (guanine527-N7)-methyltransferase